MIKILYHFPKRYKNNESKKQEKKPFYGLRVRPADTLATSTRSDTTGAK
ncbi:hypothetical protein [Segetibacter aerophilus]|nr:hypothetical protein [Segetibacter aerophilus]